MVKKKRFLFRNGVKSALFGGRKIVLCKFTQYFFLKIFVHGKTPWWINDLKEEKKMVFWNAAAYSFQITLPEFIKKFAYMTSFAHTNFFHMLFVGPNQLQKGTNIQKSTALKTLWHGYFFLICKNQKHHFKHLKKNSWRDVFRFLITYHF